MAKGTPMKHSNRNNKENNVTLYQYFTLKKPASNSHDQLPVRNEKHDTDEIPSNDAKPQKKTVLITNDKLNGTAYERKPLSELGTMTLDTKSTTRQQKPVHTSFVVLRDKSTQGQGATEAQQQDQLDNTSTLPTTQSRFNTQSVPLVDTLDSQMSITSSPLALGDSQDSFLGPGGIEFRVDALDSDDSDQNCGINEYPCYDDNADLPFFDDLEQLQMEDAHHSRQWWSHDTGDKRTYQQSFNSDDDSDDNENVESNAFRKRTISRYASAPEIDTSVNEPSVLSPLSISFDDDTNINSFDDDEYNNNDSLSQSNSGRPAEVSQQQPPSSISPFPLSFPSSTLLRSNASLSESNELLPTSPVSPLPLDQLLDSHVAYPVPGGTHFVDNFQS